MDLSFNVYTPRNYLGEINSAIYNPVHLCIITMLALVVFLRTAKMWGQY